MKKVIKAYRVSDNVPKILDLEGLQKEELSRQQWLLVP